MASAPIASHSAERLDKMSTTELLVRMMLGIPVAFVCYLAALVGVPIVLLVPGFRVQAYVDAVMKTPERVFQADRL